MKRIYILFVLILIIISLIKQTEWVLLLLGFATFPIGIYSIKKSNYSKLKKFPLSAKLLPWLAIVCFLTGLLAYCSLYGEEVPNIAEKYYKEDFYRLEIAANIRIISGSTSGVIVVLFYIISLIRFEFTKNKIKTKKW